jgi:hypothetical protein
MTCLYCDKKLSYFRALAGARYCSEEHRNKDFEKTQKLAIQRLRNASAFHRGEGAEIVEVNSSGVESAVVVAKP